MALLPLTMRLTLIFLIEREYHQWLSYSYSRWTSSIVCLSWISSAQHERLLYRQAVSPFYSRTNILERPFEKKLRGVEIWAWRFDPWKNRMLFKDAGEREPLMDCNNWVCFAVIEGQAFGTLMAHIVNEICTPVAKAHCHFRSRVFQIVQRWVHSDRWQLCFPVHALIKEISKGSLPLQRRPI